MADLRVTALAAGQVVKIHCEVGNSVNVGSQLVYLRDREIGIRIYSRFW